MAINKLTSPQSPAVGAADWASIVSLVEKLFLGTELPVRIDYDNNLVLKGSVFQIGGSVYLADADTAITGTPSDYVKITPSGSTASAAYVANLTGVTWNDTYKGYYDGSGNLHIFDEMKNIISGIKTKIPNIIINNPKTGDININFTEFYTTTIPEIASGSSCEISGKLYRNDSDISISGSTSNSTWYEIALTPSFGSYTASFVALGSGIYDENKQGLYDISGNRIVGFVYRDGSGNFINKNIVNIINRTNKIIFQIGAWNMDSTASISIPFYSTILSNVLEIKTIIYSDGGTVFSSLEGSDAGGLNGGFSSSQPATPAVVLTRTAGGRFDSTGFDDTGINRGLIIFTYRV